MSVGTVRVLNPEGVRSKERRPLAGRLATLSGTVIGLLDNSKPGGRELLLGLREELSALGVTTFIHRTKVHPSAPNPHVDEVAAGADAVIGALGD